MNFGIRTFLIVLLVCASSACKEASQVALAVYNPSDFNPSLVDPSLQENSSNHTVADFELMNQNGEIITQADYNDNIYVADFIFTRCPSICPVMTDHMKDLQEEFLDVDAVKFLSISVTPDIDSIPVLKKYALEKGVIDGKWNIATGDKKHIYELARKSYFAVVTQGDGGLQDFIHTPNFILVDTKKQIRGIYDGTDDGEMQRLIKDINRLITSVPSP